MIKHLVISGGGPNGITQLGVLKHLVDQQYIQLDKIESVYGTSVGALLGLFIVLRYDMDVLCDFFIKRPWDKVLSFELMDLMHMFQNNGYIEMDFIVDMMDRLIGALDLSTSITLQELYDLTHIEFYIYASKLSTFTQCIISHHTYPTMEVKTAILMSCALPPIFKPIQYKGEYYMDGGIFCNYPINHCLESYENHEEILGIHVSKSKNLESNFKEDTIMPEYIMIIVKNLIDSIDKPPHHKDRHEILIEVQHTALELDIWKKFLDETCRNEMFQTGIQIAAQYLKLRSEETDQASQHSA